MKIYLQYCLIRLNQLPLPNLGPKMVPVVPTTALDRTATLFKTRPHMSGTLHYHYAIPILSSCEQHHLLLVLLCGNKLQHTMDGHHLLITCFPPNPYFSQIHHTITFNQVPSYPRSPHCDSIFQPNYNTDIRRFTHTFN